MLATDDYPRWAPSHCARTSTTEYDLPRARSVRCHSLESRVYLAHGPWHGVPTHYIILTIMGLGEFRQTKLGRRSHAMGSRGTSIAPVAYSPTTNVSGGKSLSFSPPRHQPSLVSSARHPCCCGRPPLHSHVKDVRPRHLATHPRAPRTQALSVTLTARWSHPPSRLILSRQASVPGWKALYASAIISSLCRSPHPISRSSSSCKITSSILHVLSPKRLQRAAVLILSSGPYVTSRHEAQATACRSALDMQR